MPKRLSTDDVQILKKVGLWFLVAFVLVTGLGMYLGAQDRARLASSVAEPDVIRTSEFNARCVELVTYAERVNGGTTVLDQLLAASRASSEWGAIPQSERHFTEAVFEQAKTGSC